MGLSLDQLPANLRKQVEDKLDQPKRQRTTQRGSSVVCDGACECGERFTSSAKWERHSDELGAGHRRFNSIPVAPRVVP